MKNYNVKGLVRRVSIDTDCFIKALMIKRYHSFCQWKQLSQMYFIRK